VRFSGVSTLLITPLPGAKNWQLLQRASFTSVEDLQTRVLAFIAYLNATMAKPLQWTYGRKPLRV
jgi:hypothetical protein